MGEFISSLTGQMWRRETGEKECWNRVNEVSGLSLAVAVRVWAGAAGCRCEVVEWSGRSVESDTGVHEQ